MISPQNTQAFSPESSLRLEGVDRFYLLGGGVLLCELAQRLKASGEFVRVVTSTRLLKEPLRAVPERGALGEALERIGVAPVVVDDASALMDLLDDVTESSLALSFGAPWIFPAAWIERWKGRLLNLHGARLPLDRGGGGFTWQILQENRLGCCVMHQVDGGVDSGPILRYREFAYPASCRIPRDYFQVYDQENRRFLADFMEEVRQGKTFPLMPQMEYLSVYWPRLSTSLQGYVDWGWGLREIERFICAFDDPYPGASTFLGERRVFLKGCFADFSGGAFHPFQSGIVYRKSGTRLFVAAREGTLVVEKVVDEQGRSLYEEVQVGDRFTTPSHRLDEARGSRVFYTPKGLKAHEQE